MKTTWPALAAAIALTISAARANDTSAELKLGGLKFTHSSAIEMVSEDLYLSMTEVRVRYVFANKTGKDVTTTVAFPLPRIDPSYYFEPVAIPDTSSDNFVRFKTRVDGREAQLNVVQTAVLRGRNVSAQVRAAGLPLSPLAPKFNEAFKALPAATRADLETRKFIENVSGDPKEVEYRALWSLDTAYTRTQTFPARREIIVDHTYAPVVGGSVETLLLIDSVPKTSPERRKLVKDYCVDDAFESAARALRTRMGGVENVQQRSLGYVLKTGANWSGPIGRFHLTIDKGAADNLTSVCLADLKKTGPTTFELTRTNFTPAKDIEILFLVPSKPN